MKFSLLLPKLRRNSLFIVLSVKFHGIILPVVKEPCRDSLMSDLKQRKPFHIQAQNIISPCLMPYICFSVGFENFDVHAWIQ